MNETDDIERYRGDTWPDTIRVTDKLGKPVNISGFTFKMTVDAKSSPTDSTTQLFQLDGVIVDAAEGLVEFSPSEVQADNVGFFHYDVQMRDALNRKKTIKKAAYVFKQDITK